jgi:hypothetical protein
VRLIFSHPQSLPAVQAAKLREARRWDWSRQPIFSHLRSLPAVQAAKPREARRWDS